MVRAERPPPEVPLPSDDDDAAESSDPEDFVAVFTVPPEWERGGEVDFSVPQFPENLAVRLPAWVKVGDQVKVEVDGSTREATFVGRLGPTEV